MCEGLTKGSVQSKWSQSLQGLKSLKGEGVERCLKCRKGFKGKRGRKRLRGPRVLMGHRDLRVLKHLTVSIGSKRVLSVFGVLKV